MSDTPVPQDINLKHLLIAVRLEKPRSDDPALRRQSAAERRLRCEMIAHLRNGTYDTLPAHRRWPC
jgi:hypothetical protein